LFEFTVSGARHAAAAGQLDDWVHAFLTNDGWGSNHPMAVGLRKQRRWWMGPVLVPLASLTRICGPEPEMQYRTTVDGWEARVSAIGATASFPELLPPLILEHKEHRLVLCDGNHRHEALRRHGETSAWSVVWFNSEASFVRWSRQSW
jgi:hypothetical protein